MIRAMRGLLLAAGGLALLSAACGSGARSADGTTTRAAKARASRAEAPATLVERPLTTLRAPIQDGAAVALPGGRVLLLGGLSAADTSTDTLAVVSASGERSLGRIPAALHDTAAVLIGGRVYLFGGGTAANTQSDQIVRVDPSSVRSAVVGRLPAPSSDQSAAALGGTAYVVGGYTGSRWLDSIVVYRPGSPAHVVAHLPTPVRYAAVAAAGGSIVVAGGSLPNGTASDAVYRYTPGSSRVVRIGTLPAPTTHAAAAAVGGTVYVIGGRSATLDTPTSRVVAVPAAGAVHAAGRLSSPRSDLAAVSLGDTILLVGGHGPHGTESGISELVAGSAPTRTVAAADVYAYDGADMLTGAARTARSLVYVPNSESATVDVIDPHTYRVVRRFPVGLLPQHIVPSYDLQTLYVTNDVGNSLTTIDPATGRPGRTIPVADPYNMYFTPDGRYAIVVAERLHRLDFRDAHTFRLHRSVSVPCSGVDHMDFSADGRYLLASCEFSGQMVKVDVAAERVVGRLTLPDGGRGMPQDVRVSPDGAVFYVADLAAGGVWKVDARRMKVTGFVRTGTGAHGLYPSRDGRSLYVSNRGAGSVSVISFATQRVVRTWRIPGGGSPDMGGVSADGRVLWLSGRYNSVVYAISTRTGSLLARVHVGSGPHGVLVWPQPGRYSLGHTDNMR